MKKLAAMFLLCSAAVAFAAPNYRFKVERTPANGYAKPGDKIVFKYTLLEDGKPTDKPFRVNLITEGVGTQDFNGKGIITAETSAPECGFVYASGSYVPEGEKRAVTGGNIDSVAVNPEKIKQGMPEPADFDAFWTAAKKSLAAVPMNPTVTPVPVTAPEFKDKVDCFEIRLDAPGKRRAFGYLCVPKNAKKGTLPALITFDGAGVYKHNPNYKFAAQGFISLSINAHGIDFGKDTTQEQMIEEMKKGLYYSARDWDNPEKVPFFHMILRDLRGLEYLKTRPEWDGKNLISYGASQGGAQSLAVTGLSPEITFCYAGVPGLCNNGGSESKQVRGWPGNFQWNAKTKRTAGYLDNCNFATRIKCPVFTSAAWHDFLTKPSTVYAAYNNIRTPKTMIPYPHTGHGPAIRGDEKPVMEQILKSIKK